MTLASEYEHESDELNRYRVSSRREVIALLRSIGERNQLVRMLINHGNDTIVTSILKIDEAANTILLDCAPTADMNQRVLNSKKLSFETVLENIRILFDSSAAKSCIYENLPAFIIQLPDSLVRLQRREFYRVPTPVTNPVYCTIPVMVDEQLQPVVMPLQNISGGGLSLIDEKKLIDSTPGRIYENCRIDLPGGAVMLALQIRNSLELTLTNSKSVNRLGCAYMDPSNGALGAIQKYITKLERDQNAKATGLG